MDDIVIVDNFLTKEELKQVQNKECYKDPYWQTHNSNSKIGDINDFNNTFLSKLLNDNEYYTSYLFNKIKKFFNYDYKLVNVYLNGNEPLRNGSYFRHASELRGISSGGEIGVGDHGLEVDESAR